jgi:hypothetical protein
VTDVTVEVADVVTDSTVGAAGVDGADWVTDVTVEVAGWVADVAVEVAGWVADVTVEVAGWVTDVAVEVTDVVTDLTVGATCDVSGVAVAGACGVGDEAAGTGAGADVLGTVDCCTVVVASGGVTLTRSAEATCGSHTARHVSASASKARPNRCECETFSWPCERFASIYGSSRVKFGTTRAVSGPTARKPRSSAKATQKLANSELFL